MTDLIRLSFSASIGEHSTSFKTAFTPQEWAAFGSTDRFLRAIEPMLLHRFREATRLAFSLATSEPPEQD